MSLALRTHAFVNARTTVAAPMANVRVASLPFGLLPATHEAPGNQPASYPIMPVGLGDVFGEAAQLFGKFNAAR